MITGTSDPIAVAAGAASAFSVSAPGTASVATLFSFTVTALDAFGNTAKGYAGTVHFTSTDGAASLPADTTLPGGSKSLSATLNTGGNQTITATDTVTGTIIGTSAAIAVPVPAATHFDVSAPSTASNGTAFSFTVTAKDASNNTVPTYAGTVHFTSNDGAAGLPSNSTLISGVGTFSATLNTNGTQTLTATDTVTGSINGTSGAIAVSAALIPLARRTTWRPGVTYNGGIPTTRTQSGATINPIGQKATFTGTSVYGNQTLTVSGVTGTLAADQLVFDAALTKCFGLIVAGAGTSWTFNDGAAATVTALAMVSYGNDTAPINAALAAALDNTFVKLGNGTFNLAAFGLAIRKNNVTLRGSSQWTGKEISSGLLPSLSQTATSIVWKADHETNPLGVLYIGNGVNSIQWVGSINLAGDAVKGQTALALVSPYLGSVGDLVLLDMIGDSDPDVFYGNRHDMCGYVNNCSLSGSSVTFGAPQNGPTGVDGAANGTFTGTSLAINSTSGFSFWHQLGVTMNPVGITVFDTSNNYKGHIIGGAWPGPFTMSQSNAGTMDIVIGGMFPGQNFALFDANFSAFYGFVQAGTYPTFPLDQSNPTITNVTLGLGAGSRRQFTRQDRAFAQTLKVTAIVGNNVSFETPFHLTFKTTFVAQLTKVPATKCVGVGVEDLTMYMGQGGDGNGNMPISNCEMSWVKNVQSQYSSGTGISFYNCYRCEMRQCYLHETPNPNPGGGGYLSGMNNATADSLFEDNEMWMGNKCIVMRGTGGGNVIGYNYMDDSCGTTYPMSVEAGVNAGHFIGSHMELMEGNYSQNYKGDSFWGNSPYLTPFRNWFSGMRAAAPVNVRFSVNTLTTNGATAAGSNVLHFTSGDTANNIQNGMFPILSRKYGIIPAGTTVTGVSATTVTLSVNVVGAGVANGDIIDFYYAGTLQNYTMLENGPTVYPFGDSWGRNMCSIQVGQYYTNVVGNVFGFWGQPLLTYSLPGFTYAQTVFTYEALGPPFPNTGTDCECYNIGQQQDPDTTRWPLGQDATVMRQGNWDFITYKQNWHGIGGTAGSGTPAAIPNSYYLTSAPPFFGSNPWPWVDPSTGATYILPAKARFIARYALGPVPPGTQAVAPTPGVATHIDVIVPASCNTGIPFSITVIARDSTNNIVPGYAGTVHLTSSDGAAVLPADFTLVPGSKIVSVTLNTPGFQTITATDTVTPAINGTSYSFMAFGPPATHFDIAISPTALQNSQTTATITARDASNNVATTYSGIVHLTSTDGAAVLPADFTTVGGVKTVNLTFNTLGTQTLTATDTVTGTIAGTSSGVAVSAPTWAPPQVQSTNATLFADFTLDHYWGAGAIWGPFSSWVSAIGGTYARSSTATYLDGGVLKTAAANTARFPTDLSSVRQGIRLTGAVTNLTIKSNTLNDAVWGPFNLTATSGAATGPDGVAGSAWAIIPDTSNGTHQLQQAAICGPGQMTGSFFVKPNGYNFGFIQLVEASGKRYSVCFDLTTGAVTSTNSPSGSTNVASGSVVLANGWVLIWVKQDNVITGGNCYLIYGPCPTGTPTWDGGSYAVFTGNGTSGSYVFGGQMTNTGAVCDYVPTTTATATQAADSLTFPFTQRTFSGLVGTSNVVFDAGATQRVLGDNNGAGIYVPVTTHFSAHNGSATLAGPTTTDVSNPHKTMLAGNLSNSWVTDDGLTPTTAAQPINAGAPTSMALGSANGTANFASGNYTQLATWNGVVASPTEMIVLTGGTPPPSWLPLVQGALPTIYADYVAGNYWAAGAQKATFATWLTAIGGTFSRASTATYIDAGVVKTAAANVPRIGSNGIRLTGAGTNLHLHSNIGDSLAYYTNNAQSQGTITGNQPDPAGGSTAVSVVPNTISNAHNFTDTFGMNILSGANTFSTFIKPFGPNTYQIKLDPRNGALEYAWFDLTGNGAVLGTFGGATGAIVKVGNGWFLVSVTFTSPGPGNVDASTEMTDAAGNRVLTGDGVSGWFMWGRQYTASAFPLDLIPTTTAAVTQASDYLHWPFTQTTWSVLIGSNSQVVPFGGSGITLLGDESSNIFQFYDSYGTVGSVSNGLYLAGPAYPGGNQYAPHKFMLAGKPSSRSVTTDGMVPVSDANPIWPSPTGLSLGVYNNGAQSACYGNFSKLAIWNGLVASTTEMQALTT